MATIHHRYLTFPIVYRESEGAYRVYDPYDNPGLADPFIQFPNLKTAKRYVDAIQLCLLSPAPEPEQTHRLSIYYTLCPRDDGPMPRILFPLLPGPVPTTTCAHFHYMGTRGGWCYCKKPLKRGSTRCWDHERKFTTAPLTM